MSQNIKIIVIIIKFVILAVFFSGGGRGEKFVLLLAHVLLPPPSSSFSRLLACVLPRNQRGEIAVCGFITQNAVVRPTPSETIIFRRRFSRPIRHSHKYQLHTNKHYNICQNEFRQLFSVFYCYRARAHVTPEMMMIAYLIFINSGLRDYRKRFGFGIRFLLFFVLRISLSPVAQIFSLWQMTILLISFGLLSLKAKRVNACFLVHFWFRIISFIFA